MATESNQTVIKKIRAVLDEAYEEAAYLTLAHVERTGASLQTFCKEVCEGTPYSWEALRARGRRIQQKAHDEGESARPPTVAANRVRDARSTLRKADSETVKRIIAQLPDEAVEQLRAEATNTVVGRARAERREHDVTPTTSDLMEGEQFDPSDAWADHIIISLDRAAAKLEARSSKHGFVLGSMSREEAFDLLSRIEARVADARAAVQEGIVEGRVA